MAESEVAALKEALYNQHIIMKKLYTELEEEREASATAASEALAMILRLQREKAEEKMEFCQYRRMTEEKTHHAEECLTFLEEVVQQDEMEITSLRYNLEGYKQKLARNGGIAQMSNAHMDKTTTHSFIRRNISLPSLLQMDQLCSEMDINKEGSPLFSRNQSILRKVDEKYKEGEMPDFFDESTIQCHSPVWKQAKVVNQKFKELMQGSSIETSEPLSIDSRSSDQEAGSCSWYSIAGDGFSCDSTTEGAHTKSYDKTISCLPSEHSTSCLEAESNENTPIIADVHDIFEIVESHTDHNLNIPYKEALVESVHNLMQQESADWLKEVLINTTKLSTSKGSFLQNTSKLSTPCKGPAFSYKWTLGDPKVEIGASQVDFEQLKLLLKQLEEERMVMQEDTERSKEHVMLLRNIFKQLNTIEVHMKRSESKRNSEQDDYKIVSLMEAVLSFSI